MNRREAVQSIAILLGGSIVGANAFITGCKNADSAKTGEKFTQEDIAYLDEIADTILPTTAASPGAKAAQVGAFMNVMYTDCYDAKDQKTFREGMDKVNEEARKDFDKNFMQLSPEQRTQLLVRLDAEQKEYQKNKKPEDSAHYFRLMKELTLLGYFTSEIGFTKARRYTAVPGRYEGCVPYKKGDKAWA
jgi:hypothetical protein